MTDMKELFDHAAGPEPTVTDTDLTADLARGRRALRRRRITGVATAAVATGMVVGVGWSVLPISTTTAPPEPAANTTSTPKPTIPNPDRDKRPAPVAPGTAVQLVTNTTPFPGVITCDLIPKGWAVRVALANPTAQVQELYDPNLRNPKQYHGNTYTLDIRQTKLIDEGEGLTVDKYLEPWTKLPKVPAGKYQVVTSGVPGSPQGLREVYVKPDKSTRIVGIHNSARNLAWDMNTLLRFAGSCHYK
jgi:hypothetical protein